MEGEARKVSVSATDELSEIEVPSTLPEFLGTSELPQTIDELNKFIAVSKKKKVQLEKEHQREIERQCIYILAAVSHVLATTNQKVVRVLAQNSLNSFLLNAQVDEHSFNYTPTVVITLDDLVTTLHKVKDLRENKNDPGADYIDLEFSEDAK